MYSHVLRIMFSAPQMSGTLCIHVLTSVSRSTPRSCPASAMVLRLTFPTPWTFSSLVPSPHRSESKPSVGAPRKCETLLHRASCAVTSTLSTLCLTRSTRVALAFVRVGRWDLKGFPQAKCLKVCRGRLASVCDVTFVFLPQRFQMAVGTRTDLNKKNRYGPGTRRR